MSRKLHVVIASTRPARMGPSVAQWFAQVAQEQGDFAVEVVDLAEVNLPLFNETAHPSTGQYEHEATKRWSAKVQEGDAFVFVTPEYNFMPPPALVNALDYLVQEWHYKPCAFVSYGGMSGGVRAVQMAKQLVTTLKMMPMVEAVALPMAWEKLDAQGHFQGDEGNAAAAKTMLAELARWTDALKTLRA